MEKNQTGKDINFKLSHIDVSIKILIFAVLIAVTALLLRPLQLYLLDRMGSIRDNLISKAEIQLGRKIQYGSIGPSIFGVLDIRDVLILREDDSVVLSISRLRLSYSLIKLLRGNFLDTFQNVRLDKPVLNLDFNKDSDILMRFKSDEKEKTPLSAIFPEDFSLRITDGEWELSDSVGKLRNQGIDLDVTIRQNRFRFRGRWDSSISFVDSPQGLLAFLKDTPAFFTTDISIRLSGEYTESTNEGKAVITIPSVSSEYFRFKPMAVSVFYSDGKLEILNVGNRNFAAFSLIYKLDSGDISGSLKAINFSPNQLIEFIGPWKNYNPELAFTISGDANLERDSSKALEYDINFSGIGLASSDSVLKIVSNGNNKKISIDTFDIRSPFGDLEFRGGVDFNQNDSGTLNLSPIAPYGFLSVSNLRIRNDENIGLSGEFFISTSGREINIFCDNLSSGNTTLSALDLSFLNEDQGLSFIFSALSFGNINSDDSWEDIRIGTVFFEGSFDSESGEEAGRHIRSSLRLDSFSIGVILGLIEPFSPVVLPSLLRSAAGDISVTTEVFFNTDYQQILYNAPRIVAAYEGLGNILAVFSLSGTNRSFELSEGQFTWADGTASVSCFVDFSHTSDISFSLSAAYKDINYLFNGMILDRKDISIRGSYGFQVYLSSGAGGTYSGYIQGEGIPFPSGNGFASLSFLFTLFYISPSSWLAEIEKFEITGITTPANTLASFRFSGAASEYGMIIPNIYYDDGRGILAGDISVDWDDSYSHYKYRADFFGVNHNEYYAVNGEYHDGNLELFLSGHGMQLSRVSSQNALLDGSFHLSWDSLQSFKAEAAVSSFVLHRQDGAIRASIEALIDNDMFMAREFKINYSGLEATVPYFSINRKTSRANTEAYINGYVNGVLVDAALRGEAHFDSSEDWYDLLADFNLLEGSLFVNSADYGEIHADEPFNFTFACHREKNGFSFNVSGGPRNMLRFRYAPESEHIKVFYAALSAPSPVRGSITGSLNSDNIDAQITDLYVDMGSLWRFIPPSVEVVKFPGGIATGSIRIAGTLEDPEFYGTARGVSVQILVPEYLPEPIRVFPVNFLFNGTEITWGPVDALVGQGAGWANGWFRFDQWIPNILYIDIHVPSESPVPFDFDISGIIAHGLASGKLIVSMEYPILYLTGDLIGHNTEISLNANELGSLDEGWVFDPEKDSTVTIITDFSIRTGRRVEFFWPNDVFPILQAYADMGTGIRVTSDDEARRFTLTGDVKLRSGEIYYLERNFYIREGTLFFNENEIQFNPRISARAEIRDQIDSGPVTISLIIDNAPLMSFTPRFESSPPLSQTEIFSLLSQNPQVEGMEQRNLAAAPLDIAQFVLLRRVQRQVRDFLGLDMLSMRTRLFQNVVLQPNNNNDSERPYRVGNYFDNSTVFIGKYFAPEMFGEAMVTLKYDENKLDWGGMILEPEIGLEMRNPLFDIRFSIIPIHPEFWFINDTSISLIWRRSF